MIEEEQQEFQQMLFNAIEDLVNSRPKDPVRYLAISLCRALPPTESIKDHFPEIADEVMIDSPTHVFNFEGFGTGAAPSSQFIAPEGFNVNRRHSICAEETAEGDLQWKPPKYPKDEETLDKLTKMLKKNILMNHLAEEQLQIIAEALKPVTFQQGEQVIRENEMGSECYFVELGTLACVVETRGHVCDYNAGDSFGEVALMYGNIRGATISASTYSELWSLDRKTYKNLAHNALMPTPAKFKEFISNVPIFNRIADFVVDDLVNNASHLIYEEGREIITIGMADRYIYIIEKGIVDVYANQELVQTLNPFEYFGEKSMLADSTLGNRAVARTECTVFRLPETVLHDHLAFIKDELVKAATDKAI